ncbi:MAG: YfcE family phosphodiesterase [Candidatus Lokiarchaeota archaeon]|nr:YfcE family phosphodiesterase [Candidatus Lokiarchaeota archaeon]
MQRILVIGDFHIPRRAREIPNRILDFIDSQKIDLILCTGDLILPKVLNSIERIAPIKLVSGNMDFQSMAPDKEILTIMNWRIGLIHGDVVQPRGDVNKLVSVAHNLDVNVLISGHTHADMIKYKNKVLLLNPGSATAAWSFVSSNVSSFIIIEITESKLIIQLYKLLFDKFNIEKQEFEKSSFQ